MSITVKVKGIVKSYQVDNEKERLNVTMEFNLVNDSILDNSNIVACEDLIYFSYKVN